MDPETGKQFEKKVLNPASFPNRIPLAAIITVGLLSWTSGGSPSSLRNLDLSRIHPVLSSTHSLSPPVFVRRVVDGDTIELASSEKVRYIGVDTPEMRKKVGHRWITVNEPYAKEALEFNRGLVEGKWKHLELDREDRDRYGRLLYYVFIKRKGSEDLTLVNAEIIRAGLGRVLLHPPNIRYADLFYALQKEAQGRKIGIWKFQPGFFPYLNIIKRYARPFGVRLSTHKSIEGEED